MQAGGLSRAGQEQIVILITLLLFGAFALTLNGFLSVSGTGRESGQEAIREYLETKAVWVDHGGEQANPFVLR